MSTARFDDEDNEHGHLDGHPLMRDNNLFAPLNIAAYVTWGAIVFDALDLEKGGHGKLGTGGPSAWLGAACLLLFIALFVISALMRGGGERGRRRQFGLDIAQGVCAVAANALLGHGMVVVLLIIVAAQLATCARAWVAALSMALLNLGFIAVWQQSTSLARLALDLLPVFGFQAFAALTAHYAAAAERTRDQLLQVNAELMTTRALLDESARSEERLRLSRELHDVAGHSLTALKLNLRSALRDPALQDREELRIASQLADELLTQIRQVVSTLRAHDGLDLRAALEALALPLPGARIELQIEEQLRVDDLDQAEALLRCAQEAITNALRHGRATQIRIALRRRRHGIELQVDDDGRAPAKIVFGNGLIGMRERLGALGGELDIAPIAPQGMRLVAYLPERTA